MADSSRRPLVLEVSVPEFIQMFPELAAPFRPLAGDPEYIVRFVPGLVNPLWVEVGYKSDSEWMLRR